MSTEVDKPKTMEQMVAEMRETIQAKIRAEYISLMPPELFSSMVKAAFDEFTTPKRGTYHTDPVRPSPLQDMIQAEFNKLFSESIRTELEDRGYADSFSGNFQPGEKIKELVKESIPEIVTAAIANFMSMALYNFKQQLSRMGQ